MVGFTHPVIFGKKSFFKCEKTISFLSKHVKVEIFSVEHSPQWKNQRMQESKIFCAISHILQLLKIIFRVSFFVKFCFGKTLKLTGDHLILLKISFLNVKFFLTINILSYEGKIN
jgi:hypothetical protein